MTQKLEVQRSLQTLAALLLYKINTVKRKHTQKNKQAKVPVMRAGEQKNYMTCTIANQH